jgi:lipid A ethanolaminephosphotransferase
VPCLFSFDGRADFDIASARRTENVLDVLAKAGVNVLWRDNNSDSKGVAERVQYEDYRSNVLNPDCDVECRDVGMLSGLQDYIDSHEGDILIVLHQMGSHGPAYSRRYPPEFEEFRPACHTRELSECTREEITNAYDNSLLYTDYFVSKVIELLKENTPNYETAMFYVGDHGESLGENGLYLHGMPYMFAPAAQTHVPLIAWIGRTSDIDYAHTLTLRDVTTSHDSFSSSLLEAFEVDAEYFEKPGPVARLIYMKQGDDAH